MNQIKKRQINRLPDANKFKIWDAFKDNKEKITECKSYEQINKLIYGITGIHITKHQIKEYAQMAEIKLNIGKTGSSGGPLSTWIHKFYDYQNKTDNEIKELKNQVNILTERLQKFTNEFGM